ncbi:MAG: PaaI family thioesterase [Flavobacteriales bacterium]
MSQHDDIVKRMMQNDQLSQWLGIKLLESGKGWCRLEMTVRSEMVNGFGVTHGGITYCLADSALAFSSNSHGRKSMSIETSISHTKNVSTGDVLTAVSKELSLSNKLAVYEVTVTNQKNVVVALFKGTVYRTSEEW